VDNFRTRGEAAAPSPRSNLQTRILAALVLVPVALGVAYVGGWLFWLLWTAAGLAILYEWTTLVCGRASRLPFALGACALAAAVIIATEVGRFPAAVLIVALGALGATVFVTARQRTWVAGGVAYAGALVLATIALRSDSRLGLQSVLLLFAIVWATDIAGYFVGRAIGGPKLAPRLSPGKTWAGAIGGAAAAVLASIGLLAFWDLGGVLTAVLLGLGLSIASQAGDLFESWIKRRFGAKDAGRLIPGHGGVMDRLDGFWAAVVVAALIGVARGGLGAPAQGLMLW
jgi:phosphatidate cytidylyltransferase